MYWCDKKYEHNKYNVPLNCAVFIASAAICLHTSLKPMTNHESVQFSFTEFSLSLCKETGNIIFRQISDHISHINRFLCFFHTEKAARNLIFGAKRSDAMSVHAAECKAAPVAYITYDRYTLHVQQAALCSSFSCAVISCTDLPGVSSPLLELTASFDSERWRLRSKRSKTLDLHAFLWHYFLVEKIWMVWCLQHNVPKGETDGLVHEPSIIKTRVSEKVKICFTL